MGNCLTKENIFISIVIPVYNVEKYIHHCIDSVLTQTYSNFELLLIDDGSTDSSGTICDEYLKIDNRINIIHKKNSGVSDTRNVGIEVAKGDWICFIDSDDYVEPTYLENFYTCIKENLGSGLCVQGFYSDYENDVNKSYVTSFRNMTLENNYETVEFFEKSNGVHNGYIWHRIFNMEIIKKHSLSFKHGLSFAEDGLFFFQYMYYVEKTSFSSGKAYHHLRRSNSLTLAGRKLEIDTLIPVFKSYLETLLSYAIHDAKKKKSFHSFVKGYGCRLLQNWLIQKVIVIGKDSSYSTLDKIQDLSITYALQHAQNIDFSMRLLLKSLNVKNHNIRYKLIFVLYYLRLYKEKIIRRIS